MAKISLQTKIHLNKEPEIFELIVFGEVVPKGNSIYFRYLEQTPEGEIKNIVKFDGKNVSVIRTGAVKMRQNFIKGLETTCLFESPMGTIHLQMKTNSISYLYNENKKEYVLKFIYFLSAQFEQIGMYEITLTAAL
ncbi:MAG: hypothetical protein K0R71_647 [Bacillales bacterium]|jgi:uncharacterized beta-barrel protein YwiB (DUF1934 family)|nr:hypothetical protein [Bacillales bacterium]